MSTNGRVMVTGASGQLGFDVVRALGHRDVIGVGHRSPDHRSPDHRSLDLTDLDATVAAARELCPAIVVNCAAYTAVDACESNPELAFAVNGTGVANLAEASADIGAHLVQISTDYVFDGEKPTPYVETDPTGPQSVYGRSKLAGEAAAGPDATIVRTSWLCGEHGPNIVKTILRLAEAGSPLRFVDDQIGHPSFAVDVAEVIVELADERRPGIFHVTNQGAVSWFDLAREVLDTAGFDPSLVEPCATADLDPPRPAPRPANSVLDNRAWRDLGRPPTRDFREPLAELVARLRVSG